VNVTIARRWVFPILWLAVISMLAVALVKLAFFPDVAEEADPAVASATIQQPTVSVSTGSVSNDVSIDGTVNADPAVPVLATVAGTVDELAVEVGATVAAGDTILDIKVETARDPETTTGADGVVTSTPLKPLISYVDVVATQDGVVSSLPVLPDQAVAVGGVLGQIAPPTFSVTGSLDAASQYRLLTKPTEASVTIPGGPAPFTCTGLTISAPLAGSDSGSGSTGQGAGATGGGASGGTSSGNTLRCAVPGDVQVFSGLPAKVTIAAGTAENVLLVPTTAVEGEAGTGNVWVVAADGATEKRPVTLGITDGSNVEVKTGVAEGDEVLQFVPGAEASTGTSPSDPSMIGG